MEFVGLRRFRILRNNFKMFAFILHQTLSTFQVLSLKHNF